MLFLLLIYLFQVFTRDVDGEPCGWWQARIVHKKGEVNMELSFVYVYFI